MFLQRRPDTKGFTIVRSARRRASAGAVGVPQAPPIAWALERLKPLIKSIRSSLSRRLGGVPSTGFTRATLICGKVAFVALVAPNVSDSCACATSDHAAATLTNSVMNSRRFTASGSVLRNRKDSIPQYGRRLPLRDFSTSRSRFVVPRHRIAREPRLIGGAGVADKLFHRRVPAVRHDLGAAAFVFGEPAASRLAQPVCAATLRQFGRVAPFAETLAEMMFTAAKRRSASSRPRGRGVDRKSHASKLPVEADKDAKAKAWQKRLRTTSARRRGGKLLAS